MRSALVLMGGAVLLLLTTTAPAQSPAKDWVVPRTSAGHPDLEGFWSSATLTPFERPRDLAGKEFFTAEEAAAFEKRVREANDRDRRGSTPEADVNAGLQ